MLTPAQENVLAALADLSDSERRNLKVVVLATRAGICQRSVSSAIKRLGELDLIRAWRECEHGPDAVYSFSITWRGQCIVNGIKLAQEFRNVSVPG
jgi:hypothetical protein